MGSLDGKLNAVGKDEHFFFPFFDVLFRNGGKDDRFTTPSG